MKRLFARTYLWSILGPLLALAGILSYFFFFARFPGLRDFPWVNLPIVLLGITLSLLGFLSAWRSPGAWRKLPGLASLLLSGLLASFFLWYVFVDSYQLPGVSDRVLVGDRAPEFQLLDEEGRQVRLSDFQGKKVILVFYRGHW